MLLFRKSLPHEGLVTRKGNVEMETSLGRIETYQS